MQKNLKLKTLRKLQKNRKSKKLRTNRNWKKALMDSIPLNLKNQRKILKKSRSKVRCHWMIFLIKRVNIMFQRWTRKMILKQNRNWMKKSLL